MTALIISNEEMNDIMKIIKSPKESYLSIKGISQTIKNKGKDDGGFLRILLGPLSANYEEICLQVNEQLKPVK